MIGGTGNMLFSICFQTEHVYDPVLSLVFLCCTCFPLVGKFWRVLCCVSCLVCCVLWCVCVLVLRVVSIQNHRVSVKTSPCVRSKCPRVYRHLAHMCYTRGFQRVTPHHKTHQTHTTTTNGATTHHNNNHNNTRRQRKKTEKEDGERRQRKREKRR